MMGVLKYPLRKIGNAFTIELLEPWRLPDSRKITGAKSSIAEWMFFR